MDSFKWMMVEGNPVDGFSFTGPFESNEAAWQYAEGQGGDWWLARLEEPEV